MPEQPGIFRRVDPDAEVERLARERAGAPAREQQCILRGGHCFERDSVHLTTYPPQYPETCRHCGKKRIAIPREPWEYRDA